MLCAWTHVLPDGIVVRLFRVAATFGSVFGGTLFSVEVTATAYMVETLPATFFCAVVVAVVFWASGQSELFNLISSNTAQAL